MGEGEDICESCRLAVTRTYQELRKRGEDQITAFRAAMHVLALRHPGQRRALRADLVLSWLDGA